MTWEQMLTAIVGGIFTVSILSLILAPNSAAPSVIDKSFTGFTGLLSAAKKTS